MNKTFLIIDLILWVFGAGYCFYNLTVGPNPISFYAMIIFLGLSIWAIAKLIKLRKGAHVVE